MIVTKMGKRTEGDYTNYDYDWSRLLLAYCKLCSVESTGRGVCKWPDPPFGGGEQYLGLWRKDQPNTSGVFCWFFGDTYCGEFAEGKASIASVLQVRMTVTEVHEAYKTELVHRVLIRVMAEPL